MNTLNNAEYLTVTRPILTSELALQLAVRFREQEEDVAFGGRGENITDCLKGKRSVVIARYRGSSYGAAQLLREIVFRRSTYFCEIIVSGEDTAENVLSAARSVQTSAPDFRAVIRKDDLPEGRIELFLLGI